MVSSLKEKTLFSFSFSWFEQAGLGYSEDVEEKKERFLFAPFLYFSSYSLQVKSARQQVFRKSVTKK